MKSVRIVSMFLFLLIMFGISSPLMAEGDIRVHGTFGAGLTNGGDTLGTLVYTTGDSADLKAGGLFHLYGGLILEKPQSPFMMKIALGWHFDQVSAVNGSAEFDRYPLDIIPYFRNGRVRMGAGLTYHLNPKYDDSDFPNGDVFKFKNAAGLALEFGINLGVTDTHWIDLRIVSIDYELKDINTTSKVDGNHFGVYYSGMF